MLHLRPHHGMCIGQFIGKGYSADFVDNMKKVIEKLESSEMEMIKLICRTDVICNCCPHNNSEICNSGQKVTNYDNTCLTLCSLKENDIISWKEFKTRVKKNIIDKNKLSEVCINCSWIDICTENAGRNY